MAKIKKNKIISVKKLVFGVSSFLLIFDALFMPFVTEPFIGITENYLIGALLVLMSWYYFVWLNFVDPKKTKLLHFENSVPFPKTYSSSDKYAYYFHLKLATNLAAILLVALIIFGFFSVASQFDLLMENFKVFLNS